MRTLIALMSMSLLGMAGCLNFPPMDEVVDAEPDVPTDAGDVADAGDALVPDGDGDALVEASDGGDAADVAEVEDDGGPAEVFDGDVASDDGGADEDTEVADDGEPLDSGDVEVDPDADADVGPEVDLCAGVDCSGLADACHDAACDPADGECDVTVKDGAACDDGDPCTESDVCDVSGACAGVQKDCDDGNACTTDSCGVDGDCEATPVTDGVSCDDGDACTVFDTCQSGMCEPGLLQSWERTYSSLQYPIVGVAPSPAGGFVAVTRYVPVAPAEVLIVDQNGFELDTKPIPGAPNSIITVPTGFVLAGSKGTGAGGYEPWMAFMNTSGEITSEKTFDVGAGNGSFAAVVQDGSGLYAGGCSKWSTFGTPTCGNELLVRTDAQGTMVWQRSDYEPDASISRVEALSTVSGGVLVFGFAAGDSGGTSFGGGRAAFVSAATGDETWSVLPTGTSVIDAAKGLDGNLLLGTAKPLGDPLPMLLFSPTGQVLDDQLPPGQSVDFDASGDFVALSKYEPPLLRYVDGTGAPTGSADPVTSATTGLLAVSGGGVLLFGGANMARTDATGALSCAP